MEHEGSLASSQEPAIGSYRSNYSQFLKWVLPFRFSASQNIILYKQKIGTCNRGCSPKDESAEEIRNAVPG
jgi:hypothetical protein